MKSFDRESLIDKLAENAAALGQASVMGRQTKNYIQSLKLEA